MSQGRKRARIVAGRPREMQGTVEDSGEIGRTKSLRTMTPSSCSTFSMSSMGAVAGKVTTDGRVMLS